MSSSLQNTATNTKKNSKISSYLLQNTINIKIYDTQFIFNTLIVNYLICIDKDSKSLFKIYKCLKNPSSVDKSLCLSEISYLKSNIEFVYKYTIQLFKQMRDLVDIQTQQITKTTSFITYLKAGLNESRNIIDKIDFSKNSNTKINDLVSLNKQLTDLTKEPKSAENLEKIMSLIRVAKNTSQTITINQPTPIDTIDKQGFILVGGKIILTLFELKSYVYYLYMHGVFETLFQTPNTSINNVIYFFRYFDYICVSEVTTFLLQQTKDVKNKINKLFCVAPDVEETSVILPSDITCDSCPCSGDKTDVMDSKNMCSSCIGAFKNFRGRYRFLMGDLLSPYLNIKDTPLLMDILVNTDLRKMLEQNPYKFSTTTQRYKPIIPVNKCEDFQLLNNKFTPYIQIVIVRDVLTEVHSDVDKVEEKLVQSKTLQRGKPEEPKFNAIYKKGPTFFNTPNPTNPSNPIGTKQKTKTKTKTQKFKIKKPKSKIKQKKLQLTFLLSY